MNWLLQKDEIIRIMDDNARCKTSEENKILYMLSSRLLDDSDYEEVMKMKSSMMIR